MGKGYKKKQQIFIPNQKNWTGYMPNEGSSKYIEEQEKLKRKQQRK